MKTYFIILLLFICFCNVTSQNFKRISEEIQKCHSSLDSDPFYDELYYHLRERTGLLKKSHGTLKKDTIFLLELHADLVNQSLCTLVWNKKDTVFYEVTGFNKDAIVYEVSNNAFSEYMCNLVSAWDYNRLKKEGDKYGDFVITEYVNATRIIINRKKYHVDCISFKFFLDPERDKFEYIPKNKFEQ